MLNRKSCIQAKALTSALLSDKDANATMRILPALLLALLPACALAQDADPLKSPACGEALAALQQARSARAGNVEALRERAASTCLGSSALPQRPSRVAQQPMVVPPPIITPPDTTTSHAAPVPAPPRPPVAIQRPPMPAHCDGGGCWTDNGQGLQHLPPNLAGPNGTCIPHGGLVYCP